MVWPALIAAGASLIGGSKNRKASKKANDRNIVFQRETNAQNMAFQREMNERNRLENEKSYERNRPKSQVSEWELAGVNPLIGLTSGSFVGASPAFGQAATAYAPSVASESMGDAWSQAGSAIQRGMEFASMQNLQQSALTKENEALKEALDDMSRARSATASNMSRFGGDIPTLSENINRGYSVTPDMPSEPNVRSDLVAQSANTVAPDRVIERAPVEDTSLTMVMDNAFTRSLGHPLALLGSDGEPLGMGEMLSLGVQAAPQIAWHAAKNNENLQEFTPRAAYLAGAMNRLSNTFSDFMFD